MKSEKRFPPQGLATLATLATNVLESAQHQPTYHGFSLGELKAEAADDWQEIQSDPDLLEAFAFALKTTRTRQRGEKPDHYTQEAVCAYCGPVWLWEDAPNRVLGCPWCLTEGPIPRPGPVQCKCCKHWTPDAVNPPGGLGQCGKEVPGLAWPRRTLICDHYRRGIPCN